MLQTNEIHNKILEILKSKGPSLPINIAKQLSTNSLFISAFLSEMASGKQIKVSHMKVGGSPLYYIVGQEEQLENFHRYLHPKESEAFLLLKTNKFLKDGEQEPAIRVALRSIRDFAIGIKDNEEIYWKYHLANESDLKPLNILEKEIQKSKNSKTQKSKEKKEIIINNPLATELLATNKPKKEKTKPEFVNEIISFLNKSFKIIEEKSFKKNEYTCIIQINSELGPMNFLAQAKDKKSITETDLKKLLSEAQKIPLSAFLIHTGKLSKKAELLTEKYSSILKTKKVVKH